MESATHFATTNTDRVYDNKRCRFREPDFLGIKLIRPCRKRTMEYSRAWPQDITIDAKYPTFLEASAANLRKCENGFVAPEFCCERPKDLMNGRDPQREEK